LSGDINDELTSKLPKVAADALTPGDDEKSIQSKKTSGKSGASKRKSSASSNQASTPTKGPKKLVSCRLARMRGRSMGASYICSSKEECQDHSSDAGRLNFSEANLPGTLQAVHSESLIDRPVDQC
jgi:hypothetical protein